MKSKLLVFSVCLLVFAGCYRELPPILNSVRGPARVVVGQAATCTTSVHTLSGGFFSVRFAWGDGDTSDWSDHRVGVQWVTASHVWRDPGRFVVKAQARDSSGLLSEWLGGLKLVVLDSSIVKWIAHVGPVEATCPAVGPDSTIYVATSDGLVALDPAGNEKWRSHQFDADHSPVVGEDGTVYVLAGRLFELATDGTVLMADSLAGGDLDCPALGPDGTIYVSRRDTVVALNSDGSLKWESPVPGNPRGCPAVGTDSSICWVSEYVDVDSPSVFVFDKDGTRRWSAHVSAAQWVIPGEHGSFTVVASARCYRFDPLGTVLAEYDVFGGPSGQPAVGIGSELYVPTGMGLLVALPDSQSRTEFREWDLGASVLLDTAGRLYFGGDSSYNRFGIFRTGEQPGPAPIVYVDDVILGAPGIGPDGTIYIGSRDGYLYALKGNAPLAGTIWPKYAHDARNTGCAAGH